MTLAQIEAKAQQIADANAIEVRFQNDRPSAIKNRSLVDQAVAEKRGNFKMHVAVIPTYYSWLYDIRNK